VEIEWNNKSFPLSTKRQRELIELNFFDINWHFIELNTL